jgi:hypothetical protein
MNLKSLITSTSPWGSGVGHGGAEGAGSSPPKVRVVLNIVIGQFYDSWFVSAHCHTRHIIGHVPIIGATKHIFQDAMPIPHSMVRFIHWRLIVRHSAHAVHHQRRGANLAYAGLASQF